MGAWRDVSRASESTAVRPATLEHDAARERGLEHHAAICGRQVLQPPELGRQELQAPLVALAAADPEATGVGHERLAILA